MKAILNIAIVIGCTLLAGHANAQSSYDDEPVTAETFLQMEDGVKTLFAISPVKIEGNSNGFAVKWQTINESDIAFFELEAGEDKKNFTSVTKLEPGNKAHPANIYQVELSSSFMRSEKIYFRVKTNFTNGKTIYTDMALVKMRKAK